MPLTLSGVWTAIATPFRQTELDFEALAKLIEAQVAGGVTGVIACGTTGESATLSRDEKLRVIAEVARLARGRIGVLAGTGMNSTAETVAFTKDACALPVDGVLVVTPAYNKPTQEGLYRHYVEVCTAASKPVMLYNVPGRTAANMLPETVARIAKSCPNAVANKEASGNIIQMSHCHRLAPNVALICGDDGLTLSAMAIGATGVVSVVSNIAPKMASDMVRLAAAGDRSGALALHERLLPLTEAMFCESSPGPVKHALKLLGIGDGTLRLPLVEPSPNNQALIERAMIAAGVL